MNNTLIDIKIPELNDVNYATSLSEVFENINHNFSIIANHDFIKGESGKSVEFVETKFFNEDGSINRFGELLKECITSLDNSIDNTYTINTVIKDDKDNVFTVWDNFTSSTAGCIHMIYNTENDLLTSESAPVSSLQYIFMDGRFANSTIGKISNKSQYDGVRDLSCVVVYDNSLNNGTGGFKALTNSVSTLYYDKFLGLCWKINGVETGISAQGIPGNDGKNSKIYIVKCESSETTDNGQNRSKVVYIHDKLQGFISLANVDNLSDLYDEVNNMSALILVDAKNAGYKNVGYKYEYYFGTLYVKNNELYALCDPESSLNNAIKSEELINYFRGIDLMINTNNPTSSNHGLFIPMTTDINGIQPAHFISARYEGANNYHTNGNIPNYNDLILAPVNDINSVCIDDTNMLCVDRYLYLEDGNNINKYKLIKSVDTKEEFLKCIPLIGYNSDYNVSLANLPLNFASKLDTNIGANKVYHWTNKDANITDIYTIDANPTKNSIIIFAESLDENNCIIFTTINAGNFVKFEPVFQNTFNTENTSLNINYDINVAGTNSPANINVNGEISANSISIGHKTEHINDETGMPIYDGNLFVGSTINVGDNTGVIRAGELNLGKTNWFLRPTNNTTNDQLILDNSLPKIEEFKSSFTINTDVDVNGTINASNDVNVNGDLNVSNNIQTNVISTEQINLGKVKLSNKEFTFNNLGDLVVMNYDNKPFILLKSNIPDFDNPDDIMISGSMELKSETKKYDVSLPTLSRWGEQCILGKFNVGVQNYKYQLSLEDVLLGVGIPDDKFKYEMNISPDIDADIKYNYRYVVFTLDFPYSIDIDLTALKQTNPSFSYDFELKLVCNDINRTIIKKSITNLLPQLTIEEGFNSLTYILDLKTNEFLLINGKESVGFTDIG